MDEKHLETNGTRDTCPHCGGALKVQTTIGRAEEDPHERKTVPLAESNHPAIVEERRRRARDRTA